MIFSTIANFLLSEWLWGVTFDWYHIPMTILFMCIIFRWALRMGIIPAVLLTFFAHVYSVLLFSFAVVGVLSYLLDVSYDAVSYTMPSPLLACVYLGLIYAALQSSFFLIINKWYHFKGLSTVIVAALLCNLAASFLTHYLFSNALM